MLMEPTQNGAYIEIKVNGKNWKDAVEQVNNYVKMVNETYNQIKHDDPIKDWEREENRRIQIAGKA